MRNEYCCLMCHVRLIVFGGHRPPLQRNDSVGEAVSFPINNLRDASSVPYIFGNLLFLYDRLFEKG